MLVVHGWRTRRSRVCVAAGGVITALVLSACSNTAGSDNGPSASGDKADLAPIADVDDAQLAQTIKTATWADTPASDLDPITLRALQIASVPLTADQEDLFKKCMQATSCETGHGDLTVAMVDDVANTWRSMQKGEFIAGAIATPEISKVIYNTANGDLNTFLANFRSTVAQRPDIIVGSFTFGSSMGAVLKEAHDAGIAVVTLTQPVPEEYSQYVTTLVNGDLCASWKAGIDSLAEKIGENKSFALMTGPAGNAYAAAWQPCAEEAAKAHGWKKVHEAFADGWTAQNIKQATSGIIASGKQVDAIFFDGTMEDVIRTYTAAGKQSPAMIDIGTSNFAQWTAEDEAVAKGFKPEIWAAQGQTWVARIGIQAGVFAKLGQDVPDFIEYSLEPVNTQTVSDLIPEGAPPNVPAIPLLSLEDQEIAASS